MAQTRIGNSESASKGDRRLAAASACRGQVLSLDTRKSTLMMVFLKEGVVRLSFHFQDICTAPGYVDDLLGFALLELALEAGYVRYSWFAGLAGELGVEEDGAVALTGRNVGQVVENIGAKLIPLLINIQESVR